MLSDMYHRPSNQSQLATVLLWNSLLHPGIRTSAQLELGTFCSYRHENLKSCTTSRGMRPSEYINPTPVISVAICFCCSVLCIILGLRIEEFSLLWNDGDIWTESYCAVNRTAHIHNIANSASAGECKCSLAALTSSHLSPHVFHSQSPDAKSLLPVRSHFLADGRQQRPQRDGGRRSVL
jgi:hypothetical protein